jgi:putative protein kinase ArgK-like GTPase of G3E family
MLELARSRRATSDEIPGSSWERSICRTIALDGPGVDELVGAIVRHRDFLRGDAQRARERLERRIAQRLRSELRDRLLDATASSGDLEAWIDESRRRILDRSVSPYALVDERVAQMLGTDRFVRKPPGKGTQR